MPVIKRRVLHGRPEVEAMLDKYRGITLKHPSHVDKLSSPDGLSLLACTAIDQFYEGTELAGKFLSATTIVDYVDRRIFLTKIRLRHKIKYLPKRVVDIQVY